MVYRTVRPFEVDMGRLEVTPSDGGSAVHLTTQEMLFFGLLNDKFPDSVASERIAHVLWGNSRDGGPTNLANFMAVLTTRIRTKIRQLGWDVMKPYGGGYRLERTQKHD